jgi:hypothetical protein
LQAAPLQSQPKAMTDPRGTPQAGALCAPWFT